MGDWTRRDFLRRSGVAAGAAALGTVACSSGDGDSDGDDEARGGRSEWDPRDWDSVRDQFPLSRDHAQFAAFVLAAHPRPLAEEIQRYRDDLDRDTEEALSEHGGKEAEARQAAANYLGGQPEHVALTDSTTMGLGLLYNGLRLSAGDEVLTTEHDFFATHEALRLRAARDGVTVRRVRLYDQPADASADEIVDRLTTAVRPETRAVAVTWVHSSTGVKLPIPEIAASLRDANADRDEPDRVLLCVDGVHGFGLEDTTAEDLGCDFLVSGTHKWLFGPRGTGLVWGRPAAWERVDHIVPSFSQVAFESWIADTAPDGRWAGDLGTPGGYHSFEHRWAVAGAFAFHQAIGRGAVADRTKTMATALKEGLAELDGVSVVTPVDPELSAGIVCVEVADHQPFELIDLLRQRRVIASVTPYAQPYLRFGPSLVTTPDDVDRAVEALAAIL